MATIRSFRDTPPGGWRYVQPETGVRFESDNWDDLLRQILPHRRYKGIPLETLEQDVQRQLCLGLDEAWCRPEPGEDYRPVKDLSSRLSTPLAFSLTRAIAGAVAEVAAGRAALADPAEAARRADICRRCPFNKPASMCSCSAIYKAIDLAIPKDRRLVGLGVCMACGCTLQAKVNLPQAVVEASNSPDVVFPSWCWQPGAPLQGIAPYDTTA